MGRRRGIISKGRKAGFSLLEMLIALGILVVVMLGITVGLGHEFRQLDSITRITATETRAQEMLSRLEQELIFAQGFSPVTVLTADLASAEGLTVSVATTVGLPDQGLLLIDRGTAFEERIQYESIDPGLTSFSTLTRGQQCTDPATHPEGATVLWASLAEPIANQINPPAELWDGVSAELTGPTFFQGDGTGFSFRVPTDPAGGTDYLDGGEVTWGATVGGQPILEGWSILYYRSRETITEGGDRDFNNDGDRNDTFDLGQIRMRSWDSSNPGQPATDIGLCPPMILQEQCNWGTDLDNDGFDDPIFLWNPAMRTLHIRMFILGGATKDYPVVRRAESMIFLRNAPAN